jgi:hypothetical protein
LENEDHLPNQQDIPPERPQPEMPPGQPEEVPEEPPLIEVPAESPLEIPPTSPPEFRDADA